MADLWGYEHLLNRPRQPKWYERLPEVGQTIAGGFARHNEQEHARELALKKMQDEKDRFAASQTLTRDLATQRETNENARHEATLASNEKTAREKAEAARRARVLETLNKPIETTLAGVKPDLDEPELTGISSEYSGFAKQAYDNYEAGGDKRVNVPNYKIPGETSLPLHFAFRRALEGTPEGEKYTTPLDSGEYTEKMAPVLEDALSRLKQRKAGERLALKATGPSGDDWLNKKNYGELAKIDAELQALDVPKSALDALIKGKLPQDALDAYGAEIATKARNLLARRSQFIARSSPDVQSVFSGFRPEGQYIPQAPSAPVAPRPVPVAKPPGSKKPLEERAKELVAQGVPEPEIERILAQEY